MNNETRNPSNEETTTPHGTEFRVGQYGTRAVTRDTFVGVEHRVELFWHQPEVGVTYDVATFDRRHVMDACAALQLALLDSSNASTRDWLLADTRWKPPGSFAQALHRVLDYLWSEEERDYRGRDSGDRAGHIFEDMLLLKRFAAKTSRAGG